MEEIDLLEEKQVIEEMLTERRNTEVEEWRDTVIVGSGVTLMAVAGSRSSQTEGDLFLSEVGVLHEGTEEDQRSF